MCRCKPWLTNLSQSSGLARLIHCDTVLNSQGELVRVVDTNPLTEWGLGLNGEDLSHISYVKVYNFGKDREKRGFIFYQIVLIISLTLWLSSMRIVLIDSSSILTRRGRIFFRYSNWSCGKRSCEVVSIKVTCQHKWNPRRRVGSRETFVRDDRWRLIR